MIKSFEIPPFGWLKFRGAVKIFRKSSLTACGLAAALAITIFPARSFADIAAYITVTETSPSTVRLDTNLTGFLNAQSFTIQLFRGGYYPPGDPYSWSGPNVRANDISSQTNVGDLVVGDNLREVPNPYSVGAEGVADFINWLDPASTPGHPLYDTLAYQSFGYSMAFATQNELPNFGVINGGCYNDLGIPVPCPIAPYGTVINNYYNLSWSVHNAPYDTLGRLTTTFVAEATPEPGFYGLMGLGLSTLFLAARRRHRQ
jgi:hypothetical protein